MGEDAVGQRAREHGHTLLVLIELQMRDLFGTDLTAWRLRRREDGTDFVEGFFSAYDMDDIRDLGTDLAVVALVRAENALMDRDR